MTSKSSLFRTDTKALVGAVLLGIVFIIACQATGFIDNLLPWGKAGMYLLNGTVWSFFTAVITLLYQQPAGIIAGEIEAVLAVFFSPLWLCFIFANALGSFCVSLLATKFTMDKWLHHFICQLAVNIIGNTIVCLGLMKIYGLPGSVAAVEAIIITAVCTVLGTVIEKTAYTSLKKSGLM